MLGFIIGDEDALAAILRSWFTPSPAKRLSVACACRSVRAEHTAGFHAIRELRESGVAAW